MTVGYGPVKDIGPHGPLSPVFSTHNPFDTPAGSPKEARIPDFHLDDDSARRSHVIRKVNSGFEILRPGTLGVPRPSTDNTEWNGDVGDGIKRQSRKLQKKPRPSSYSIEEP